MSTDFFKPEIIPELVWKIIQAFPLTLILTVCSLILGSLIALGIAVLALRSPKVTRGMANGYIHFIRGIPTLILIYLLYLGFPQFMKGLGVDMSGVDKRVYLVVIFALAISANFAELMRSSYLSVDKGQGEAALAIGMTARQGFKRIVLPQALAVALPSLGNYVIMLFKLTSLGFVVGVVDLMGKTRILINITYGSRRLETYLALAIIYWALCFVLERINKLLITRYTRGRRELADGKAAAK
ncbi:MAG: amino acid ABC transporter permease [Oscillospiraceae bacterium]|jgi:L-cystine transport system permease protein|nr:amino acid ABC transporter permease [Oscillospiraceae bacterium]